MVIYYISLVTYCKNVLFKSFFYRKLRIKYIKYPFRRVGLTHHDIKDENVVINYRTLECKLIDFGCARLYKSTEVSYLQNTV